MGVFRRRIPGNARVTTALVHDPDAFSIQAASLGWATNTYSRASMGTPGFAGDPGFGVNRWAGDSGPQLQHFAGLVAPIGDPLAQRLGIGAGPSGQPGMPSTGDLSGALGLTYGLGLGMGG